MGLSTTKVVRLTFSTAGGKTFALTIDNPKEDLQMAEAMAAMNSLIESDIFLTPYNALIMPAIGGFGYMLFKDPFRGANHI